MITPILVLLGAIAYKLFLRYHKQHCLRYCKIEGYSSSYLIAEAIDTYYYIYIVECYSVSDFIYLRSLISEIDKRGLADQYADKLNERIATRGASEEQLDSAS